MIGGTWREYSLNSHGTIYTDADGPINYGEYGAYVQLQKDFLDERLKFIGSIRYDKAQNFDGNFSPRLSLNYTVGKNKNQNIRAAFQTGFRNPTTQDQYIGLDAGAAFLVGSAKDNLDRYYTPPLPVSQTGQALGVPSEVVLSGGEAYYNSFTAYSVLLGNPEQAEYPLVKPEFVTAYEVGYRGGFGKFSVDVNAYYNHYKDFIGNKNVIVPYYGNVDFSDYDPSSGLPAPPALIALQAGDYSVFQVYTNSSADISSYGGSLGLSTRIYKQFTLDASYTFAKFEFDQASDPDYEAGFNTPENMLKIGVGNSEVVKNLGFNINYRWNDVYFWESSFADGKVAARNMVDAQISYSVLPIKSVFKIGGANIGGNEYYSAPGNGRIGSQYYISWTVNP
jgi:hypothetical protein